jgi:hypothetical protein
VISILSDKKFQNISQICLLAIIMGLVGRTAYSQASEIKAMELTRACPLVAKAEPAIEPMLSVEPCELCLSLLQDRYMRICFLLELEKISVCGFGVSHVTSKHIRPPNLKMS